MVVDFQGTRQRPPKKMAKIATCCMFSESLASFLSVSVLKDMADSVPSFGSRFGETCTKCLRGKKIRGPRHAPEAWCRGCYMTGGNVWWHSWAEAPNFRPKNCIKTLRFWVCEQLASLASLVGGWTTHLKKYGKICSSNCYHFPKGFVVKIPQKMLETTTMEIQCLATSPNPTGEFVYAAWESMMSFSSCFQHTPRNRSRATCAFEADRLLPCVDT